MCLRCDSTYIFFFCLGGQQKCSCAFQMAKGLHDQDLTPGAPKAYDHEGKYEALSATRGQLFLKMHLTRRSAQSVLWRCCKRHYIKWKKTTKLGWFAGSAPEDLELLVILLLMYFRLTVKLCALVRTQTFNIQHHSCTVLAGFLILCMQLTLFNFCSFFCPITPQYLGLYQVMFFTHRDLTMPVAKL